MALQLKDARTIVSAVLSAAREASLQPVAVIVLDAGGQIRAFESEDGTSPLRFAIAHGKAFGAVGLGVGSRALMARAEQQPYFIAAANGAAGGQLIPVPGGVLFRNANGELVGAVGVSGDSSDHDEMAAVAGITAAGFVPDPG